jgi:CheY-like chemotaxis protein
MLVDDNDDLLFMLATMLGKLTDAEIRQFRSPASALEAFAAAPEKYELVITDYEMPEMDGVELCRRMHSVAPTQKIVLTTGSGFFTAAVAQRAGFNALLNKPYSLAEIHAALAATGIKTDAVCVAS